VIPAGLVVERAAACVELVVVKWWEEEILAAENLVLQVKSLLLPMTSLQQVKLQVAAAFPARKERPSSFSSGTLRFCDRMFALEFCHQI